MKKFYILTAASLMAFAANAQTVSTADFENLNYTEGLDYETGEQLEGSFKSGEFYFINSSYLADYGEWGTFFTMKGFCYSKRSETTFSSDSYDTDQFNNQVGAGAEGSEGFAVAYDQGSTVTAAYTFKPQSCYITNNVYAINSIMNGDNFARRFNYDDKFTLTIKGYKDEVETETITFDLAAEGRIVFQWIPVDLTKLGEVDKVVFSLSSTDSGDWGMNTPAYFCLDNFTAELTDTPTSISKAPTRSNDSKPLYDLMGRKINQPMPGVLYIK